MTKIICPLVECKNNGVNYVCKCKEVKLDWRNMMTVNEGRVDMWICKQYEMSESAKQIDALAKTFFADLERMEKNE